MSVFLFLIDYLQRVNQFEVIIVGGGLAGLTAALDLARRGKQVLLIEKNKYPNHKVCGEYVSNEVRPYLQKLGLELNTMSLPQIDTLQLSTSKGSAIEVELPLGGFGISRYKFDNELYQLGLNNGVEFLHETAVDIMFDNDEFQVRTLENNSFKSKVVLGAHGKRSNLDLTLKRRFTQEKSPWLAVKCHYLNTEQPANLVSLHNFEGGYGGLSQIEEGKVNFCYLVKYENFKSEGDITSFNEQVVSENPFFQNFLSNSTAIFEKPQTIAQISFHRKEPVENHILMCGDTAGLIHPLCGNGMAMAIQSAKIAADQVVNFLENPNFSRTDMEGSYKSLWNENFRRRLWMGRQLQGLMMHTKWFNLGMNTLANSKTLVRSLIRTTHGTPILN
ncbi:NAD(P)/FAD-dependent oxidoreductase [Flagellimonas sp. S3867]|uniref:NAD(P)/FAD-dependent oxidoreductase n=1 Tax=Flagellimonas sp. S3867 TaxID=2768063 RepID=UPI001CC2633E|nr:NAD(P)/FAD-dependent oxidoreductase [Flagellimonas sp. S3867]